MTDFSYLEWLASKVGKTGAEIYAEGGGQAFKDLAAQYGSFNEWRVLTDMSGDSVTLINNVTGEIETVTNGINQTITQTGYNAITTVDTVVEGGTTTLTTTSGANAVATTTAGQAGVTMSGVTMGTAVMSGLAVLGGAAVGVKMYDDNPEFWTHVSKALLPFAYDQSYTDSGNEIKDAMNALIPTAIDANGKSYLKEDFLNTLAQQLTTYNVLTGKKLINQPENISNVTITNGSDSYGTYIDYSFPPNTVFNTNMSDAIHFLYSLGDIQINKVIDHYSLLTYSFPSNCFMVWGASDLDSDAHGAYNYRARIAIIPNTTTTYAHNTSLRIYSDRLTIADNYGTYIKCWELSGNTESENVYRTTGMSSYSVYQNSLHNIGYYIGSPEVQTPISNITAEQGATYPSVGVPLATTYPTWFTNKLQTVDPNSTPNAVAYKDWLPVSINNQLPTVNADTTTATQTNAQTGENPAAITGLISNAQQKLVNAIDSLTKSLTKTTTNVPTIPPTPITTGTTETPAPPVLSSAANGLWSIYNPTETEIRAFGAWLWDSSIIDQLVKMVSNPMNAIIGLHILYATPVTNGTSTIKAGYLDSNVSAKLVSNQYSLIDCGEIEVPETHQNSLDYNHTTISIYLPFIGIVGLNTHDVMGGKIHLTYRVDVLTGTCLAQLEVIKQNSDAILYTYNGNCAVQIPLTSGNYGTIITGLITAVGGIALSAASGGSLMPAVAGVGSAIISGRTNVQQSGNLGSNAGAMGIRTPYLIITRPINYNASLFNQFYGFPSNKTVKLGNVKGFTKCKYKNLSGISATEEEKQEISRLLETGVFIE